MASPWIYRPWLDLVAGCGAWSAPLLLLVYVLAAPEARAWSVAFYALALVFNYPHFMATIYRAYGRSDTTTTGNPSGPAAGPRLARAGTARRH